MLFTEEIRSAGEGLDLGTFRSNSVEGDRKREGREEGGAAVLGFYEMERTKVAKKAHHKGFQESGFYKQDPRYVQADQPKRRLNATMEGSE